MAQSPQVLAQLLRDNPRADPHAYTTPASVFNTLAVDFGTPDPAAPEPPLHTRPIPATRLHRLDPPAPAMLGRVAAQESVDNLSAPPAPPGPSSPPADTPEPCPSRVRSLERAPSAPERGPARVGSLERAPREPDRGQARVGSLERAPRGPDRGPTRVGSLERDPRAPDRGPTRMGSLERARQLPVRLEPDVGQFAVQGALNAQLAASVVNKMRLQPEPPLVEEIYDFGGDHVKSCAAIAAQRALGGRAPVLRPVRPARPALACRTPLRPASPLTARPTPALATAGEAKQVIAPGSMIGIFLSKFFCIDLFVDRFDFYLRMPRVGVVGFSITFCIYILALGSRSPGNGFVRVSGRNRSTIIVRDKLEKLTKCDNVGYLVRTVNGVRPITFI